MAEEGTHEGWNYKVHMRFETGDLAVKYSIHFYRQSGDWFDEIRYDSHERRHGQSIIAPHFHMKLSSPFKNDTKAAVEQIKSMIDNDLQRIQKAIER
jgi:hypothetical protein